MSVRQFANSLSIIRRVEHSSRSAALVRHIAWQLRKLAFPKLLQLKFSRSILADDEPGSVLSQVNMLGLYDYNNMNLIQKLLLAGDVIFDVGANIGSYTILASENPDVRVISLEPNPAAFRKLQRNIHLNVRHNVQAMNIGASDRCGTLHMTARGSEPTNRIIPADQSGSESIEVEVQTLDELCRRLSLDPVVIKIDVEGHEPEVLRGADECLGRTYACIVENGERLEIVRLMHAHGFDGPYYYHHKRQRLTRVTQKLPEDAVYVAPQFKKRLPHVSVEL